MPQDLRTYLEMTNPWLAAPLPEGVPAQGRDPGEDLARRAEQASRLLTLQAHLDLEGDVGLFRDLQSILFSCGLQFLLPALADPALKREHDLLLHVLWAHASKAWRDQPAHGFFLQSQVTDYVGRHDATRELLEQSLALTPASSHEYLTRVHALWAHLLEHGEASQAEAFLWDLHRHAPREHVSEIREMLRAMLGKSVPTAPTPRTSRRKRPA